MTGPEPHSHDHDHDGHSHPHTHSDAHTHSPDGAAVAEQQYLGPSNEGSVMLDIGGDIGALVLITPPELLGAEIEVSRIDAEAGARREHVAIRERRSPGGTRFAGIYPSLRAGEYTVWGVDGQPADRVTVEGGRVAQLDWS